MMDGIWLFAALLLVGVFAALTMVSGSLAYNFPEQHTFDPDWEVMICSLLAFILSKMEQET